VLVRTSADDEEEAAAGETSESEEFSNMSLVQHLTRRLGLTPACPAVSPTPTRKHPHTVNDSFSSSLPSGYLPNQCAGDDFRCNADDCMPAHITTCTDMDSCYVRE
jgi:hypothetical protein